jgi:hypothetical protein
VRHSGIRVGCGALPSGSEYRVPDCGRSCALNSGTPHAELSFTDAVHQFNAGDCDHRIVSAQLTAHSMLRRDGTEMVSTINEVDTTDERSLKPFET